MPVERAAGGTSLIDVLDRVLDKGIVIDAWVRVSLVGIDLITVEARIVVASIDTYLKYSEAVGQVGPGEHVRRWRARRMRKSLQKTPPSGLSSERAPLPVALRRVGAVRHREPKRQRRHAGRPEQSAAGVHRRAATRPCSARACGCSKGSSAGPRSPTARTTRCSGSASASASSQSICLVKPAGEPVAVRRRRVRLAGRRRSPASPSRSKTGATRSSPRSPSRRLAAFPRRAFGRGSQAAPAHAVRRLRRFTSLPLGVSGFADEAFGLLLVGGSRRRSGPSCTGSRSVFGQKLDQILRQQALADGDRKQGRERSLLYSIINAVTDPILLTDTEGRLLIANARALTLFTASEEESEGRRGAVRMNNMLLSSALSSKAIEETGASAPRAAARQSGRRLGPAVRAAQHGHRGSAAGHRRRLDSAQRHRPAARERGDRGELPHAARRRSAGARRERSPEPHHRLGRRPDRRHRRGRRDVADERAGRAAVHDAARGPARSSSAGCRPTTRTSRRSSPACSSAPISAASARSA